MFIERPPVEGDQDDLFQWCEKLYQMILLDDLHGSVAHNFSSIADGDEEAKDVTVTGAALGDYAVASLSVDVKDCVLDAQVTAANTVTCVLANNTGTAQDIATGTIYVRVFRRTV